MLELSEEDVVLGARGLMGWAPLPPLVKFLDCRSAPPPPPHPQRTQLGVPGPEVGVRRRLPTGSQTHSSSAHRFKRRTGKGRNQAPAGGR